jgi:hypothetical protein
VWWRGGGEGWSRDLGQVARTIGGEGPQSAFRSAGSNSPFLHPGRSSYNTFNLSQNITYANVKKGYNNTDAQQDGFIFDFIAFSTKIR